MAALRRIAGLRAFVLRDAAGRRIGAGIRWDLPHA